MKNPTGKTYLSQAIILASIASAQQTTAFEIEEVVVTAQKRAESLQDVPVSVSALGSSDLEGLKLRASTEIAAQVPNMQMQTPFGDSFPMISMRGISMSDFSPTQSSPVAVYVDEVYRGNPAIQGVQMFDLERVEVLRGPQGTLYGKNTTGGAVNFITKTPTHDTEGYVTAGFGDFSRKELQGAYQTSLVDDVIAMRVAGTWTESDGFNENKAPGKEDGNSIDDWGARVSLSYTPSDELEMILRVAASESKATNAAIIVDNTDPLGARTAFGFSTNPNAGLDDHEYTSDFDDKRNIETSSVSLTVNYDLTETLSLTSITSWDDGEFFAPEDTDGSSDDLLHVIYDTESDQIAQDLRLTSNFDGNFNFIAGLYYAEEEIKSRTDIDFFHDSPTADPAILGDDGDFDALDCLNNFAGADPSGCTQYNAFTQTRESIAAYLHSTYDISNNMSLTLGLRYTEDSTDIEDFFASVRGMDVNATTVNSGYDPANSFNPALSIGISQSDLDALGTDSFTDREWSGKLGLDYTTDDGTLIYASYSKGFRGGAFNGQSFLYPTDATRVDPEKVDAYEVGFKAELLDNTLQLNGAAFYYDYSDQQFLNVDAVTASQVLLNVEESSIKGAELELTSRPIEPLTLRAGLGWLDTEIDKGTLDRTDAMLNPVVVDLKGNEVVAAPEWNFNLSADYEIALNDAGVILLHLDTAFVDDQFFSLENQPNVSQDDYWVTNGRVSFESADDALSVAFWVKNIEDKVYKTYSIDLQAYGWDYNHLGAPRTMGVEATFRF